MNSNTVTGNYLILQEHNTHIMQWLMWTAVTMATCAGITSPYGMWQQVVVSLFVAELVG